MISAGDIFGRYTVVNTEEKFIWRGIKRKKKLKAYKCICICGNINIVAIPDLIKNKSGCIKCQKKYQQEPFYRLKEGDTNNWFTFIMYCKDNPKNRRILARCKCGKQKYLSHTQWKSLISCGCAKHRKGIESANYKGTLNIPGDHIACFKRGAKSRNIEFNVSDEYLESLFVYQNKRCALTNIKLWFANKKRTASLDRIDSKRGYVEGNLQWVHKDINVAKHALSQKDFIYLCHLVAEKNLKPKESIFGE